MLTAKNSVKTLYCKFLCFYNYDIYADEYEVYHIKS